ncbi:MAG: HlyC/CorC family transporter [Victivallales bacterium]|nr:HlyC/CorC family transporter [Victivallales bacterium]
MYYELLLGILLLLFLSGVFSASETAMMSLSRAELKRMSGGDPSEKMVCRLLKNPQRLLSTILVGNMFVNVLLASLFATLFERCLASSDGMGPFERLALFIVPDGGAAFAAKFGHFSRLLLNVLVVTPLLMVFGEQTPKVIAFANGAAISRKTSAFFAFLCIVFTPLNWILHFLANIILRLFGQKALENEREMTADELLSTLSVGKESGATDSNEIDMLERIVALGNTTVREVMTHRVEIVGIRDSLTLHDAFNVARSRRHAWYPVYHRDCDDIWGMLCLFDMLKWRGRPEMNMTLSQFRDRVGEDGSPISTPAFAPETARVDKLLSEMRRDAREIVVVVDEYGGTSGVVTQDDLIEELVGRFANGEVDVDALHRRNDGSFLCDGRAHLRVLEKTLGENYFGDDDDADTIGGLIMERTESIPKAGTEVVLEDGTKIMVRRMSGRRVRQVLIVPPKDKGDGE